MTTLEPWPLSADGKSRTWRPEVLEQIQKTGKFHDRLNETRVAPKPVVRIPDVFAADDLPVIGGETMATVSYCLRHGLMPVIDQCPRVRFVLPVAASELGRVREMWPWRGLSPQQAKKAYDEAVPVPMSREEINRIVDSIVNQPTEKKLNDDDRFLYDRSNVYLAGQASMQAELDALAGPLLSLADLCPLALELTPVEGMDLRRNLGYWIKGPCPQHAAKFDLDCPACNAKNARRENHYQWIVINTNQQMARPLIAQAREAGIAVWCEAEGIREVPS